MMVLLPRMLRMAVVWALGVVVVGALGMLVMRFHARDYAELVPVAAFAAAAGAIFVPIFAGFRRRFPAWSALGLKAAAGAALGIVLSVLAAGLVMHVFVSTGGIKGARPSSNIFDYLMLTSVLIPLCAATAAATPRRFLDG